VPRGSLGMIVKYCTPVSQVGFVGDRNPPPSLPSISVAFFVDSVLSTVLCTLPLCRNALQHCPVPLCPYLPLCRNAVLVCCMRLLAACPAGKYADSVQETCVDCPKGSW